MDRITDRPNMTSAVDRGGKALTQLNSISVKNNSLIFYNFTFTLPAAYNLYTGGNGKIVNKQRIV